MAQETRKAPAGNNVQLDLVTILGVGIVAFVAIGLYRHSRGSAVEENGRLVDERRDVHRAIKSMRKD